MVLATYRSRDPIRRAGPGDACAQPPAAALSASADAANGRERAMQREQQQQQLRRRQRRLTASAFDRAAMSLSISRSSEAMRARPCSPALRSRLSRALLASCSTPAAGTARCEARAARAIPSSMHAGRRMRFAHSFCGATTCPGQPGSQAHPTQTRPRKATTQERKWPHLQLLLQRIQLQVELLHVLLALLLCAHRQRQAKGCILVQRLAGGAVQAIPQALGPDSTCRATRRQPGAVNVRGKTTGQAEQGFSHEKLGARPKEASRCFAGGLAVFLCTAAYATWRQAARSPPTPSCLPGTHWS